MNQDRLRFDLADLAEEVTPVDLRDRALRTSRRLGLQRAAATSAAVLVVLAAATGTALAIRPNSQTPVPAGPSVTVTAPPVEPTPTPSAEPSSTPSTSPSETTGGGRTVTRPSGGSSTARPTWRTPRPRRAPSGFSPGDRATTRSACSVSRTGRRR